MANEISTTEKMRIYSKIVAKCWANEEYKKKFSANPNKIIEEEFGIKLQTKIKVLENSEKKFNLVFDQRPEASDITLQELAAAGCVGTIGTAGTAGTATGTVGSMACIGTFGSYEF